MKSQEVGCLKAARLFSVCRGVSGSSPLTSSLVFVGMGLSVFSTQPVYFQVLCMQFLITFSVTVVAFLLCSIFIGGKAILV